MRREEEAGERASKRESEQERERAREKASEREREREREWRWSMESIYKATRQIKRKEHSLYNALRSIYHDSLFVTEIHSLWGRLPLLANLRCGLWYAPSFHGVCYFKSTDGHNGNWSFNVTRLNLHVAYLAGTAKP